MAGMVEMNGLVVVDRRLGCPGQLGWVECWDCWAFCDG